MRIRDHPVNQLRTSTPEQQDTADRLVFLNDPVKPTHKPRNIKRVYIALHRSFKLPKQFLLDALQQVKAVGIMGVKGRAVQFCSFANLLDGDFVDRLVLHQLQQCFFQHHLGVFHSRIRLHCASTKSLQIKPTVWQDMLLFFQLSANCLWCFRLLVLYYNCER